MGFSWLIWLVREQNKLVMSFSRLTWLVKEGVTQHAGHLIKRIHSQLTNVVAIEMIPELETLAGCVLIDGAKEAGPVTEGNRSGSFSVCEVSCNVKIMKDDQLKP